MGLKASHLLVSFLVFAALVTLLATAYDNLLENYDHISDQEENSTISQLNDLDITNDVNQTIVAFEQLLAPDSVFDILGGLAAASQGGFEVMKKLFTAPYRILVVVQDIFHIPPAIMMLVSVGTLVYVSFVLINLRTKRDD